MWIKNEKIQSFLRTNTFVNGTNFTFGNALYLVPQVITTFLCLKTRYNFTDGWTTHCLLDLQEEIENNGVHWIWKNFLAGSTRRLCPVCQQGENVHLHITELVCVAFNSIDLFYYHRLIENFRIEKSTKKLSFLT